MLQDGKHVAREAASVQGSEQPHPAGLARSQRQPEGNHQVPTVLWVGEWFGCHAPRQVVEVDGLLHEPGLQEIGQAHDLPADDTDAGRRVPRLERPIEKLDLLGEPFAHAGGAACGDLGAPQP